MNLWPLAVGGVALGWLLLRRSPLPKGSKVLLVGDSLGVGLKTPLARVADGRDYLLVGSPKSGSRAPEWVAKLTQQLAEERPALVLVSLGTNDALAMNDPAEAPAVRELVQRAHAAGAKVAWILPPVMPKRFEPGLSTFRAWAASSADFVLDSTKTIVPRSSDEVHPLGDGYARWADWIWSELVRQRILKD